jgi:YD repeat-containing protein
MVTRRDRQTVGFEYDALGRRTAKLTDSGHGHQSIITDYLGTPVQIPYMDILLQKLNIKN